jgi:hypothetical protein
MARKGRKPKSPDQIRVKINLTIHPEIREWAETLKRRRSISLLFEDLVEAEWNSQQAAAQNPPQPATAPVPQPQPAPYFHHPSPYYYAPAPAPQAQQ